ncbi:hypothetical protein [Ramlibacter algicola]|uniref:Uncharacterized protein n=1 Tax=Ramlibacter algicola TaxID=2795217 RepID=A0A934PV90_9BURK|nr:hypothetical protein [Ramlibacter algicola]MBK0391100.1 hypothetical protein [Ramlibacter algicola]
MRRTPAAAALLALAASACSPTFNWREVRAEPAPLKVLLPCKPDKGSRRVPLGGHDVDLAVIGCDAGGATFAVLQVDAEDPSRVPVVLEQWQRATLLNLHGTAGDARPFAPAGSTPVPGAQRVSVQGQRADGSPVRGEIAYFTRGTHVFQAVVYAPQPRPEWVQPFFDGLKFE